MKKLWVILFIVFIVVGCNTKKKSEENKFIVTDDLNNEIIFNKKPERIISLAPNITEMIYELKLEKYLVGNTIYCDYPEKAKKVEKVGDMFTFNFEKIVSLKPDLIFITVEGNTKETYDKFKDLGLNVFVSNPRDHNGIKKTLTDIGKIYSLKTDSIIHKWDSIIQKIRNQSKEINKTGMFIVQLSPLMVVGPNTFLNEFLTICGLKNIAYDSPINYPVFNREEVVKRNPDYIIFPNDNIDETEKIIFLYPEWKNINAVKNKNIIFVNRNIFARPGPRFIEGVEILFNQILQREAKARNHLQ